MRKIETEAEKKKRQRRNQWIIGIILIFVMLGSTLGYAFTSITKDTDTNTNSQINYNGFSFQKVSSYWLLNLGSSSFYFIYNPKEISNLSVPTTNLSYLNNYNGKPLYVYSENPEANLEIYQNLQNVALRMQSACFEKSKCQGDWPLKDCTNNFIIIENSSTQKIEQKENCVFIEGKSEDLTKLTDKFLYKIIGVEQ